MPRHSCSVALYLQCGVIQGTAASDSVTRVGVRFGEVITLLPTIPVREEAFPTFPDNYFSTSNQWAALL